MAEGNFAGDQSLAEFERELPAKVRLRLVVPDVHFETALRRTEADPSRGLSKDPVFLSRHHEAFSAQWQEREVLRLDIDALSLTQATNAVAASLAPTGPRPPGRASSRLTDRARLPPNRSEPTRYLISSTPAKTTSSIAPGSARRRPCPPASSDRRHPARTGAVRDVQVVAVEEAAVQRDPVERDVHDRRMRRAAYIAATIRPAGFALMQCSFT